MRSKALYALSLAIVAGGAIMSFVGDIFLGLLVGLIGAVGAYICANPSKHEHDRPSSGTRSG